MTSLPVPSAPPRTLTRFGALAAVTLVLALAPQPVASQGATTPDSAAAWLLRSRLVFGASRYAQDVGEAPASVTIVTSDEIEQHGLRTLADILAFGAGVFTHYDRNYTYATFRGMTRQSDFNTRILLLIDGHRINDAATDASGIGTDGLIDVAMIEHVEIISGPGSVLFGTNAVFGVVNVVTRRGRLLRGLGLRAEGGSYGVSRGVLSWGQRKTGGPEYLVSVSAERREGRDLYFPEFDSTAAGGVARGLDGEYGYRALVKASRGDFSFLGASLMRRREVPTASYATVFNDPRLRTDDRTATAVLTYEHSFTDLSRVFVSSAFDTYVYHGIWPYEDVVTRDYNDSRTWTLEGAYIRFLGSGNKLAIGGESRWLTVGRIGVYDEGAPSPYVDLDQSMVIGAAFAQLEWRLGNRSILYAGARHDRYETFGGTTNPRVALVVRPRDGLTLKALYGRAFRAPNLYELHYEDGDLTQKAPPSLLPETVESTELSLDQQIGSRVHASVSAYRIRTQDLINLETDPADDLLVFANDGQPRSSGVEFKLTATVGPVRGRASYAFQRARDDALQTPVNSPRQLGYASASVPFRNGRGNLGVFVRHLGERPTLAGTMAPGYTTVATTLLARPFSSRLEILAQVQNLFDVRYADPGGEEHLQNLLPRDGRSIRLGLSHRY
jgi:iron complex outermembrane receptor protein